MPRWSNAQARIELVHGGRIDVCDRENHRLRVIIRPEIPERLLTRQLQKCSRGSEGARQERRPSCFATRFILLCNPHVIPM
jgi:hypothetical protein